MLGRVKLEVEAGSKSTRVQWPIFHMHTHTHTTQMQLLRLPAAPHLFHSLLLLLLLLLLSFDPQSA